MRLKKWGAIALAALTAVSLLGGCSGLENKSEAETVAATFGDEDIMMDYVMFQMRSSQYGYEQLFGAMYGTTDFWHQEYAQGVSIETYLISSVMTSIRQTKVLCDYAEKNGIALTEEQQAKVDEAVKNVLESSEEEYVNAVGLTEDLLKVSYQENALANLAYMDLIKDVDTTVEDDEFIRKDIVYVKLTPTDMEENSSEAAAETSVEDASEALETEWEQETEFETEAETETDAQEDDSTVSGEELFEETETTSGDDTVEKEQVQKEKIEDAADEIAEMLADGEKPEDIIAEYNSDTTYFTTTQSTVTIGEESVYVYTDVAYALEKSETAIYNDEATNAVYVLLCTNENNEDARQDAIETEIADRKRILFAEKYAAVQEASPKFTVETEVIATINFDTALYIPKTTEATTEAELETEEASEAEVGTEEASSEAEVETEAETEEVSSEAEVETETVTE